MVVLRQRCCIRAKVVLYGQKWFYSGKSDCIRAKLFYSGKVIHFFHICCNLVDVVVFGQSGFILTKGLYSGKRSCYQTKEVVLNKVVVFGQK